jgi:hypothetical protein
MGAVAVLPSLADEAELTEWLAEQNGDTIAFGDCLDWER